MHRFHASGKVILLGEHAVVYGYPALALGIERGVTAWCEPCDRAELVIGGFSHPITPTDDTDLGKAFAAILRRAKQSVLPGRVIVKTELPPGGGLGCSAALGVAIARAVEPGIDSLRAMDLAMEWEKIFHGNPSGVDAAVAALGGVIYFRKGEGPKPVQMGAPPRLIVGHSGMASSTRAMVESVALQHERHPEKITKSFEGLESLVNNAVLAIGQADWAALGKMMDLSQMILGGLFLSTPEIETMCASARAAGALGAKLTGAGGGGCVVALVSDDETGKRVMASWRGAGFECFATEASKTAGRSSELQLAP